MHTAIRGRQQTFVPVHSSRTLTITNVPTQEDSDQEHLNSDGGNVIGSLRLTGGHRRTQRVAWGEDVVDNEGCGKKKSKICCIYHKSRRFDESSSEESSDSDSENDCRHDQAHSHFDGPSSSGGPQIRDGSSVVAGVKHEPSSEPNAYEKRPNSKKGKRKA